MDVLLPAIYQALEGDADLGDLTSFVRQHRRPESPKNLRGVLPAVVFWIDDAPDERGLHGAAINPEVLVEVHGYGADAYKECVEAAQRVSEIFVGGISTASGGNSRWGELLGWQSITQTDPDAVVLRTTFQCRYWSSGRIAAVDAARGS